jgi:uncharacterized protein (TIGR02996 family)
MSEERSFLQAIRAKTEDRTTRLVYADWLDEHDDARGALIRIEEEIRTTPIYSDRYWELKPRHRAHLKSIKRSWLKQMGYGGTDYQPVFADVPTGWKERWRLIREFTERWYQIPVDDVGGPLKPRTSVPAWEETDLRTVDATMNDPKVSAGLPPSLREWAFFVRDLQLGLQDFDSGSGNRHIFGPYRERRIDFHFLLQNGGRDGYQVRDVDRHEPDPPVWWVPIAGFHPSRDSSRLVAPHVTTLALQYLLTRHYRGFGSETLRQKMTKKFARQLANFFPVHAHFDETQIFERSNVIALWMPVSLFTGHRPCFHLNVRPPPDPYEVLDQLFERNP